MLTSTMFYDALLDAQEEEEITRLADTYAQVRMITRYRLYK